MESFIFRQKICIFTVKIKFKAKERQPYKAAPTSSQGESAYSVPGMYEDKAGYSMTRSQFQ